MQGGSSDECVVADSFFFFLMVLDLNSSSYCLNEGGWVEG